MLTIIITGTEIYDESTNLFSTVDDVTVDLEHSLVSLSKWESKHQKAFLTANAKTPEEIFDYMKCMIITPKFDLNELYNCSKENLVEIQEYIDSPQTATTFRETNEKNRSKETITSELIYYWMTIFNIPFECQTWHLNRLLTLIKICGIKQNPPKKLSRHEAAQRNRELNAQRKAELGTTG